MYVPARAQERSEHIADWTQDMGVAPGVSGEASAAAGRGAGQLSSTANPAALMTTI